MNVAKKIAIDEFETCRIEFGKDSGLPPREGAICPQCKVKHWPKEKVNECLKRHDEALKQVNEKRYVCYRCGVEKPEPAFRKHKDRGWETNLKKIGAKVCNTCFVDWGANRKCKPRKGGTNGRLETEKGAIKHRGTD